MGFVPDLTALSPQPSTRRETERASGDLDACREFGRHPFEEGVRVCCSIHPCRFNRHGDLERDERGCGRHRGISEAGGENPATGNAARKRDQGFAGRDPAVAPGKAGERGRHVATASTAAAIFRAAVGHSSSRSAGESPDDLRPRLPLRLFGCHRRQHG